MARKVTDKEILQYLYEKSLGRVVTKIDIYVHNPYALVCDLSGLFHKLKYNLLTALDPPPPDRKNESALAYFDRIHPRFGMRFFEMMCSGNYDIDLAKAYKFSRENVKDKKALKIILEFMNLYHEAGEKNKEYYQRYKIRSEMLKNPS